MNLNELSLGQKKKFLLSFGLASKTPLMILDEPTNGLDIPSKSQFRRIVASAMTEDRTFIISTHQVRDMENLIDPIIILHNGQVVFNSTLEHVCNTFTFTLERTEQSKRKFPVVIWLSLSVRTVRKKLQSTLNHCSMP
jgi:ABC-2 type transport system ATP-binding protein